METTTPTTNTKIQKLAKPSQANSARMANIDSAPFQPPASSSSVRFSVTAPPAMISLLALATLDSSSSVGFGGVS